MTERHGIRVKLKQTAPIPLAIELNCENDEILALVGPSGSGKTTVLRAIAGLYQPKYGQVYCQQETWFDSEKKLFLAAHKRKLGFVFQNYALFPHLTTLENISAALAHLPKQNRQQKALELLATVHLNGLEQRYPKQLSGGQQQRVAVARALAREPNVLLLDEPFSAVDQVTRRRLYRELYSLRRSLSIPIILVTHDLEEANLLADKLCLLHKGKSLQTGTPLEVASKPISATVARLMDQQNIFTAQVIAHDVEKKLTLLRWHQYTLEARYQPNYPVNQSVCWMIQSAQVLLHRRHRTSNGEQENPLSGVIIEYMILSGYVSLLIEIDATLKINLSMSVPLHVAKRNQLQYGERISVSLLSEGIHLMPFEKLRHLL